MKWQSLVLVFILTAFIPGAFADGDKPLVTIKDYKFVPQEITIKRGQTLRWENREKRQYHSVWFEALGEEEPADYMFPDDESFAYTREFKTFNNHQWLCAPLITCKCIMIKDCQT